MPGGGPDVGALHTTQQQDDHGRRAMVVPPHQARRNRVPHAMSSMARSDAPSPRSQRSVVSVEQALGAFIIGVGAVLGAIVARSIVGKRIVSHCRSSCALALSGTG